MAVVAVLSTALVMLAFSPSLAPAGGAAPAASAQALDVLVVGDSYSAGNGATGTTYGPAGCYRNTTSWGEKYAAGLRGRGYSVTLANHACSGGVTADVHTPREMGTQSGRTTPAPAGVTTTAEGDTYLRVADPCNTRAFPDEEFWTYRSTSVSGGTLTYDCTRMLRAQADFVSPDTDLVVFTMGGNDAGFSTIVQGCFVSLTRSAAGCRSAVDAARSLLPTIRQRLTDDVAALRAHGLRADARIVQLGYPWLQVDNGFALPDPAAPLTPYPAGEQVRSLVTDATAQLATVPAAVNGGHPGQMSFVGGVTTKFSGHEPDAAATNPHTWLNEAFSSADTNLWYHPNDAGQTAYAELLLAEPVPFPTSPTPASTTAPTPPTALTATLRVRPAHRRVREGRPVTLRVSVRRSDGSTPTGRVVVRRPGRDHAIVRRALRTSADGRLRLRVRGLREGRQTLVVTYRDRLAGPVRDRAGVRIVGGRTR